MRILLDEFLPRELAAELAGHNVTSVQQAGWSGLKNGELLKQASDSFEVFLTIDQQIGCLTKIPADLAVITIRARSNRIQDLRPLLVELLQALASARPGKSTVIGPSGATGSSTRHSLIRQGTGRGLPSGDIRAENSGALISSPLP